MCGIGGAIAPNASQEFKQWLMENQLWFTETRGKDASGVGWFDNANKAIVYKKALAGSDFVGDEEYLELAKSVPNTWVIHCRKTTKGSEKENKNNHPLTCPDSNIILVHNGVVDDTPWRNVDDSGGNPYLYGKFEAEVDTEVLVRMITTMRMIPRNDEGRVDPELVLTIPKENWKPSVSWAKAIDDATYNISGSFACAVLVPDEPDTVYLFRHNNPLFVAYIPKENTVVFTSTEDILKRCLTTVYTEKLFGLFPKKDEVMIQYHGLEIDNDSLVKISVKEKGFVTETMKIDPPIKASQRGHVIVKKESAGANS